MQCPILVVGRQGPARADLREAGGDRVVAVGRPDLDLTDSDLPARALDRLMPAAIINAGAYTAVDRRSPSRTSPSPSTATGRRPWRRPVPGCAFR
jgi:dTDP-4-dehydrorhamnose reductase